MPLSSCDPFLNSQADLRTRSTRVSEYPRAANQNPALPPGYPVSKNTHFGGQRGGVGVSYEPMKGLRKSGGKIVGLARLQCESSRHIMYILYRIERASRKLYSGLITPLFRRGGSELPEGKCRHPRVRTSDAWCTGTIWTSPDKGEAKTIAHTKLTLHQRLRARAQATLLCAQLCWQASPSRPHALPNTYKFQKLQRNTTAPIIRDRFRWQYPEANSLH